MAHQTWTVWGVAELGCWLGHFPDREPTGHDAEDCLDAHIRCGITHIVWNLGRSVLAYHSALPDATCYGTQPNLERAGLDERTQRAMRMFRERCQLRAALDYGRRSDLTIVGRLCMNRHYGAASLHCSEFARTHPEWLEIGKDGETDGTRLCYAIPEVRRERVAILREAAQLGCDGLCLDFCRQPPMARYHPALTESFRECTGIDPLKLRLSARDEFLQWCRHRADAVTAFLAELREALESVRAERGERVPVRVRIPNDGFEANLIAGLDVQTWAERGLIDGISLSELRWLDEYTEWDDAPYIRLGRGYSLPVFASSSCLPVQASGWSGKVNPAGVNALVLARRALRSLEAGAYGISLYQSDTGVQWPGLREALPAFGDEAALRRFVDDPEMARQWPLTDASREFGIDNHSKIEGMRAEAGTDARGV